MGRNIFLGPQKIIYLPVPKAANSSIKQTLLVFMGMDPEAWAPIHDLNWRWIKLKKAAERVGCFRFTVVRNPWDRLVSCWADKCIRRDPMLPDLKRFDFYRGMPFDDFACAVCEIPDDDANIHFVSQSRLLVWRGEVVPEFVGRFERLDADWDRIRAIIFDRTGVRLIDLPRITVSEHEPYQTYYSSELRDAVGRRYAEDVERFGYTFESIPHTQARCGSNR